eukprot:2822938-Prymnesium_polylepis.1
MAIRLTSFVARAVCTSVIVDNAQWSSGGGAPWRAPAHRSPPPRHPPSAHPQSNIAPRYMTDLCRSRLRQ